MTKVLIIDNSTYVTGAVKSIVGVASRLQDVYEFEFAMDGGGAAADFVRARGFAVHHVTFMEIGKSPRALVYPIYLVRSALKLIGIVRATSAEILHVNDVYNLSGLVAAVMRPDLLVVHHVRLLKSSYLRPIYNVLSKLVLSRADAVVAVSRSVQSDLGGHQAVRVISDALNEPPSHPPKSYRDHRLDCRFLYVGNYVSGKGHDLAIKAFSSIAKSLPGSTLRMVGAGVDGRLDSKFVSHLKNLIVCEQLDGRVTMDDRAEDVEAVMKSADVILIFSDSESFSLVCLEAMTFGAPVISTDSGGPGELIEHEVTGLLIPCGSTEEASEAMMRLAQDVAFAEELGRRAATTTSGRFSVSNTAARVAEVYAEVLQG